MKGKLHINLFFNQIVLEQRKEFVITIVIYATGRTLIIPKGCEYFAGKLLSIKVSN